MGKEITEVFWSPAPFISQEESWNLLYPEPYLLKHKLQISRTDFKGSFFICPSTRNHLKNLFVLNSAITDEIDLPIEYLKQTNMHESTEIVPSKKKQIVALKRQRPSSLKGYSNLLYNLSWLFFCAEPLTVTLTAPYLPAASPSTGAILASGTFDIGEWFRPINLDYHVPLENNYFSVMQGQELAYVNFHSNKQIKLKRFVLNETLYNLSLEMSESSLRYNPFQTLTQRYEMAKKSKIKEIILKEIKNNVVE